MNFHSPVMSETSPLESGGYPSFSSMLIYLPLYFVVELAIKKTFKSIYPDTFSQLYQGRKDAQYFAFIMGILITVVTTPFCVTAFVTSHQKGPFELSDMSIAGQICIASRSVLWVSELNRLDHATAYIAHHLSSLGFLVWHLQNRLPLQILYGFYSSLATELLSDVRCLLDIHNIKPATSVLAYRIQLINMILLVVLRIPPIIYTATFFQYWPITGYLFWVNASCLLFYTWFIFSFIPIALKRLEVFRFIPGRPAYVRVCQKYNVSVYGIFFALASFSAAMATSIIYLNFWHAQSGSSEKFSLIIQLVQTGFAGLVGARVPSIIASRRLDTFLSIRFFDKTSLWLQGALVAMGLSVLLSYLVDRYTFFLALCASLPLSESLGRLGCYFAGCCGHFESLVNRFSLQVKSSGLNFILGVAVLGSIAAGSLDLEQAAGMAVACNSLVRLYLRPNTFAFGQFVGSLVILAYSWQFGGEIRRKRILYTSHDGHVLEAPLQMLGTIPICVLAVTAVCAGVFVQLCGGLEIVSQNAAVKASSGKAEELLKPAEVK